MEDLNSVWQIGIFALIAGALIGILAYRHLSPSAKETDRIKSELAAARDELSRYRTSVNQHFDKTSELVNDLTQNYVRVYQHLAEGAQTLGDGKTFNNRLEHHPGKVSIALDDPAKAPSSIHRSTIVDAAATPLEAAGTADEHAAPFTDTVADDDGAHDIPSKPLTEASGPAADAEATPAETVAEPETSDREETQDAAPANEAKRETGTQ